MKFGKNGLVTQATQNGKVGRFTYFFSFGLVVLSL
ncbi:MAG: hypothetical protein ACJAWH_002268 [Maribacter sp.]|jgi:hypothetical protein